MAVRHTDAELAHAAEDSFIECYGMARTSSPGGILRRDSDLILFQEGGQSKWVNGVLYARFTSKNKARKTEGVLSYFRERNLPMTWFVGPSSTPPELGDYLRERGLTEGWTFPGMAIDLGIVQRQQLPVGLTIHVVSDMDSLQSCVDIAAEAYGFEDAARQPFKNAYMGFGISSTKRWFLGKLDGKPVAASTLVLRRGLAVPWLVMTLREARGRGIGTAMTRELLLLAKDMGYDFAVLQSSEKGLPVYEKMGFKECCRIKTYSWSPKMQ
jgi:GNAT superfamily N-acetyltransferase